MVSLRHLRPRPQLIPLEVAGIGLRLTHGSLGPSFLGTGGRLSNTRLTCPGEGDNPGKLGLIPHR